MGFYIRKSVSVGPFRFNLSKSGVGVSVGAKGFRVGTGPRGNYVHVGGGGLYYRATLSPSSRPSPYTPRLPPAPDPAAAVAMREIDGAAAHTIVDTSSTEIVAELNEKSKKVQLWPWAAVVGISLSVIVHLSEAFLEWVPIAIAVATVFLVMWAYYWDRLRKTTVLLFDLDAEAEKRYGALHKACENISRCGARWHITSRGEVHDRKYHAGAGELVNRKLIRIGMQSPPYVQTNVATPSIPAGRDTLYLFPDKLLIFSPSGVGAISYRNLKISTAPSRFIESDSPPRDAERVGITWKYVNKKGGPDRRFKDNCEIPIMLYEEIQLSSDTGLLKLIQVSKVGLGAELAGALKAMAMATRA